MRKPFVAGNWKMFKGRAEARALVTGLQDELAKLDAGAVDVLVCPPYPWLCEVAQLVQGSSIWVGAQNVHEQPEGAYTGEVSVSMLKDAGCSHVIIGHSERRQHFGEQNDRLRAKVQAALAGGLQVIYCVGETIEEREAGRMEQVLDGQLREVLTADLDTGRLTIAYEPVWAIGTGKTATPEIAQAAHAFIRGQLSDIFGAATAGTLRIQYGGSVKPGNAAALMAEPDIDGALVGGACLVASDFAAIIAAATASVGAS